MANPIRVTQAPIEVVEFPTSPLRVTQNAIEAVLFPTSGLRVTQDVIEVIYETLLFVATLRPGTPRALIPRGATPRAGIATSRPRNLPPRSSQGI